MKVSREGVVLIKSFEGFRPRAVRGDDGRWLIGYGHSRSAREGLTVGEQDAELLLQYDLLPVVKALNDQVAAELNQHQFDALASFAISIGVDRFLSSDVLHRLNEGLAHEAAEALIGWPEATPPDAPLRRRAAERALFNADPAAPVQLAALLAAPLPAPVEPEPPVIQPVFSPPGDARAAAVATLLGEPTPTQPVPDPEPAPTEAVAEPALARPSEPLIAADREPAQPPAPAPAPAPAPSFAAMQLQRYSPYSAALIGPLPGFPSAIAMKPTPPPEPEPVAERDDEPAPAPVPVAAPEPTPVAAAPSPQPIGAAVPSAFPPVVLVAPPAAPVPAPSAPVAPLVPPAPGPSPFPPMEPPLVLTPATEADFPEVIRPIWGEAERSGPAPQETVLFEDEPALTVLRHEVETTEPRRFDWGETGAYMIMGGLGLASCAFSAGAFRLSVEQPSPMGETTLIAWVLALIGAICVGVSSWNLYVRWGKAE